MVSGASSFPPDEASPKTEYFTRASTNSPSAFKLRVFFSCVTVPLGHIIKHTCQEVLCNWSLETRAEKRPAFGYMDIPKITQFTFHLREVVASGVDALRNYKIVWEPVKSQ